METKKTLAKMNKVEMALEESSKVTKTVTPKGIIVLRHENGLEMAITENMKFLAKQNKDGCKWMVIADIQNEKVSFISTTYQAFSRLKV